MHMREGEYFRKSLLVSASLTAILLSCPASAAPQGSVVSAGSASIGQAGPVTTIAQGSDRAVIDWQGFDVGAGERVEFRQPSANSVTLNRIHGADPSQIHGAIDANGQVVLVNPSGILFGKSAKVNVGGLVASTADTGNDTFMAGGPLKLTLPGRPDATISNEGTITAKEAGLAALVGPNVRNDGTIIARTGTVQLAGAETATVDLYGDGLLSFAVTDRAKEATVTNGGRIEAGHVLLSAADAASLVTSAVNTSGIIEASHMRVSKNGSVVLGGDVALTAREVTVGKGANIRADGRDGGGTVRIGGGWQGEKIALEEQRLANAQRTVIEGNTFISANATHKGHGGTVVAWSDGTTRFAGEVQAKGGARSGDGGKIETSGKQALAVTGSVDASAPRGKAGDWLLDPQNVTISGSGANSVPAGGGTYDPSGATNPYTILDSSISAALSSGNSVTITTANAGQAQTGDIVLSGATILKSGGGDATLTLKADGSIVTSGANSISSNTGKLHMILWADADNVFQGKINLLSTTITTNGGDIILAGGPDNGANGGVAGDGRPDDFAKSALDYGVSITTSSILNAGGGDIIAYGYGLQRGITTASAQIITSGMGNITFIGSSYGSGTLSYGTNLNNGSYISAESGTITLRGSSTGAATNNYGTIIENSANSCLVETTSNGNISITGTQSGTGSDFYLSGAIASTVRSLGTGTITINADKINTGATATIQTNGSIAFKPRTAGTTFGVSGGTCGSSCGINLTDAGLARLFPDNDGNGVGSLIIGDRDAGTGLVEINGWDLSGKTYDVEVYGGTVYFTGNMDWNGGNDLLFYSRTGGLVINNNFTRNAGTAGDGTLTLKAFGSIYNNSLVTHAITSSSAALNTILWANAGNANSGAVVLDGTTVTTAGGDLYIGGGLDDGSNGGTANDGRPDGYAWGVNGATPTRVGIKINNNSAITTASGSITLRGHGTNDGTLATNHGINLTDASLTSSGGITMIGVGGTGTTSNAGTYLSNATVQATGSGDITITGTGNGLGSANVGVHLISGSSVLSDSGDIHITGTSGSTGTTGSNIGVVVSGTGSNRIQSGTGDITITGYGRGSGGSNSGVTFGSALGITSSGGDISITGTGSTTDTGSNNYGINSAGPLSTTGIGTITLNGTGGGTGGASINNYGYVLQNGATVSTVNGTIDITGIGGTGAGNYGFFTDGNVSNRIGTSGTTTSNITISADRAIVGVNNVYTSGDITLKSYTAGRAINVVGGSGGLDIGPALLDGLNGGGITIGDATSGLVTVNPYASWASRASSGVNFLSGSGVTFAAGGTHDFGTRSLTATPAGPLAVNGAITVGTALLRATGASSDITLGATGSIAASDTGNAITLASGDDFLNSNPGTPLSTPSGRWLIYSEDPAQNAQGTLLAAFTRDSCTYGGACPTFPTTGNGYLYRAIVPGSGSSGGGGAGGGGGTGGPSTTPTDPVTPLPPTNGGGPVTPVPVPPAVPSAINLPRLLEQAFAQAMASFADAVPTTDSDNGRASFEEDHWIYGELGNSDAGRETGSFLAVARELLLQLGCGGDGEDKSCQALKF